VKRLAAALVTLAMGQALLAGSLPRAWDADHSPGTPPSVRAATLASFGETAAAGYAATLYVQTFDAQAGRTLRIGQLDADAIRRWLDHAIDLNPASNYPLLLASRVYGESFAPHEAKQMIRMVQRRFFEDPDRRWPWVAHAIFIARHGLQDPRLATELARSLRIHATGPRVPSWARQAEALLLADLGEVESARILLGALVSSGSVTDAAELEFLTDRLRALESGSRNPDAREPEPSVHIEQPVRR
jgi:hypothetical protein